MLQLFRSCIALIGILRPCSKILLVSASIVTRVLARINMVSSETILASNHPAFYESRQ